MLRCVNTTPLVSSGCTIQWSNAVPIHVDIKLVPRVAHNDKENPLTSSLAHILDSPVPEADGSMWIQFTHEQGRKEGKTIFAPLLCSCYSLTKALMDNVVWYIGFWEYRLHLCLPEVHNNTIHRTIVWILPLVLVSYSSPKFDMETLKKLTALWNCVTGPDPCGVASSATVGVLYCTVLGFGIVCVQGDEPVLPRRVYRIKDWAEINEHSVGVSVYVMNAAGIRSKTDLYNLHQFFQLDLTYVIRTK